MSQHHLSGNAIGIDLGGTRIKGVLISLETGEVLAAETLETHDGNPEKWKNSVKGLELRLKRQSQTEVRGIGLAAPGLAAPDCRSIASMPGRMAGLEGLDWTDYLGYPVKVINDAHAALVAEMAYGCARGLRNVVMLTLGTGVGGALWLNGELFPGNLGRAGHLGHFSLRADSTELDIVGTPGSLEDAIGNVTVARRTYNQYHDTVSLLDGYHKGDPLAVNAWLSSVRDLAAGIASLVNVFSPDLVVLAGGIVQAGDALFIPLHRFLDLFEWRPSGNPTSVRKANFHEWAGAVGAAAWINQQTKLSACL